MKATAIAYSNQGLIKYWGKSDEKLNLPSHNSIGVCLDKLMTKTTVEFSPKYEEDVIVINNKRVDDPRVKKHLDLIRKIAGENYKAKVMSINNFPLATGLASSASGFAALTLAASLALNLTLTPTELSKLARLASGSASRSIVGGFAELLKGSSHEDSYSIQLAPPEAVDMKTLVVIVESQQKEIGSTEGMQITARSSPFYKYRLEYLPNMLSKMRKAIQNNDFAEIGRLAEIDTLNMHACMLTSDPPLIYWSGGTIEVIHKVRSLRKRGIPAFFSIDAGSNVFINTSPDYEEIVTEELQAMKAVKMVIPCNPGGAAHQDNEHLF
jgi:diphosphomevalonate decarboxylase